MTSDIKKGVRLRHILLKYLPKKVTSIIVKLKGTGILKYPTLIKPENPESLVCTIAYNKYGAFCTPDLHKNDTPVQAVYRGEQYENKTMQYISSLNFSGDIIHAGAYFGDSIPALSSFIKNDAILWAFEPNPLSFRCAQITILLNNLSNVKLHKFGIADSDSTLNLLTTSLDGTRHLGGTARLVEENIENTLLVHVKKCDDVIPHDRTISIIHIDVEGFEEKALLGASKIISKYKPLIISEVREGVTDIIMNKLGYKFHLGLEEKTWVEGYRNAVFKHKDSN